MKTKTRLPIQSNVASQANAEDNCSIVIVIITIIIIIFVFFSYNT